MKTVICFVFVAIHATNAAGEAAFAGETPTTLFGGNDSEQVRDAIVAADGTLYVVGTTASADLPVPESAAQGQLSGNYDGYVARFDRDGNLLQATYIGGGRDDAVQVILETKNGDIFIAGVTKSDDLPGTAAGVQPQASPYSNGVYYTEIFVMRLAPDLSQIEKATYFGDISTDWATSLLELPSGEILLGGHTSLLNKNSFDYRNPAGAGMLVAVFSSELDSVRGLVYGGNGDDRAEDVILHNGELYLVGSTSSEGLSAAAGYFQPELQAAGEFDMLLVAIDLATLGVSKATYLGSIEYDSAQSAIVVDDSLLIAGVTHGEGSDHWFPGIDKGANSSYAGGPSDVVVTKLPLDFKSEPVSLFLGGRDVHEYDRVSDLQLLPDGLIALAGSTTGDDLPNLGGFGPVHAGAHDVFITLLKPDLREIVMTTYLGGSQGEDAPSVALAENGPLYILGHTASADFAANNQNHGKSDVFITALTTQLTACGNGFLNEDEECDDGNLDDGDSCSAWCLAPVCGNRIVEDGEDCEPGETSECGLDCRFVETDTLGCGCNSEGGVAPLGLLVFLVWWRSRRHARPRHSA